jgi:hypothetical protein
VVEIVHSNDGGLNWQNRKAEIFEGKILVDVEVTDTDARSIWLLTSDNGGSGYHKYELFYSADSGITWEKRYQENFNRSSYYSTGVYIQHVEGRSTPLNFVSLGYQTSATKTWFYYAKYSGDGGRTFTDWVEFWGSTTSDAYLSHFYTPEGLVRSGIVEGVGYKLALSKDWGKTWQELKRPFKQNTPSTGPTSSGIYVFQPLNSPSNLFMRYAFSHEPFDNWWWSPDSGQTWQAIQKAEGGYYNRSALLGLRAYSPLRLIGVVNGRVSYIDMPDADKSQTKRVASNQIKDGLYFPETGHNLSGVFLDYWQKNGGLAQFGYPKTEPFREINPSDGKVYLVQYFERNRFEYHPENKGTPYEVQLGLLGTQMTADYRANKHGAFNRFENMNYPSSIYFPETGHNLRSAFKDYWKQNGGLAMYGYPISEEFYEVNPSDGKTYVVQYFERNRFEWHPENTGTKYEVLLGLLGNDLLKQKGWL